MFYKIVFVLIVWHCLTTIEASKLRFNLEVYNVTCRNFTNLMKKFECDVQKLASNHYHLRTRMMFQRNLGKEIAIRLSVELWPRNGKKSMNFVDLKVNLCVGLSQSFSNILLKDLMDEARRSGNLPYSCPMKANFLYKVENYTVRDTTFPAYAPFLNATFTMDLYEGSQLFGKYTLTAALVPKS